jgi:hypothetical protein
MIRLAKLALWALQDDHVALAWLPCDNHVWRYGNKHQQEKDKKSKK